MRRLFDLFMQTILYIVDPVFRDIVNRKSGPDDKLGAGETVTVVLRRENEPT